MAEQRKVKDFDEHFQRNSNPQATVIPFGMETFYGSAPPAYPLKDEHVKE